MNRTASRLAEIVPPFGRRRDVLLAFAATALVGVAWIALRHPFVGLAAALIPFAVLIVLSRPMAFAIGFVVFSFFRIHEVFPQLYPMKIPLLLSLATLTSLGWHLWIGKIKPYWCREFTAFALFFMIVTAGLIMASNRGEAMNAYTGIYIKIAVMVLAVAWLLTERGAFRIFMRVILLAGLSVAVVALSNKMNGVGLVEGTRVTIGRDIGSMLGDPNDLALVLLFPASFALSTFLNGGVGRLEKAFGLAVFIAIFAAIVATQSRGGLLGIAAVVGLFSYRRVRSKILMVAVGCVALTVLYVVADIGGRASGGAGEAGIDESAMHRLYAWEAAVRMAIANPLTGVGIDNFFANFWAYTPHWTGRNYVPHSTWFGVLAETGFLGFSFFVIMIGLAYRTVSRSLKYLAPIARGASSKEPEAFALAEATLGGFVGFVVSGTFLTMGFTWPVYLLLSLAAAIGRFTLIARRDAATQNALQPATSWPVRSN